jgi:hypothetical protein
MLVKFLIWITKIKLMTDINNLIIFAFYVPKELNFRKFDIYLESKIF